MSKPDPSAPLPLAGRRIGLVSSWLSRRNGGVFAAVLRQADLIQALGATPVIIGLRDADSAKDIQRVANSEVLLADPSGPDALGYSRDFPVLLREARLDMLHCHGIWQAHVAAAGRWARHTGRPLIVSPHGMLDPWIKQRGRWKKQLARIGWERQAWHAASLFHALTEDEGCDIRREVPSAQIAVVPNPAPPVSARDHRFPGPTALFLGRLHKKKNLDALLAAWRIAQSELPNGANLIVAGWEDGARIARFEHALGDTSNVNFVGAAFGSQKQALFDVARFFVLPSLSEGLPMAVLEAWAAGVPSIMSEACHLPAGFASGAAIPSGTAPHSIAAALLEGFGKNKAEWDAMSQAASALASGPFGIDAVAMQWRDIYGRFCV